jgi:hypothetical protein
MTLSASEIATILRLAQDGVSLRDIAILTHHARGTVRSIVNPRTLHLRPTERQKRDAYNTWYMSTPTRCPTCRQLVKMPCVACSLNHLPETT